MSTIEELAQFLRLNYVAGTTDVPWSDATQDERNAWLAEAETIASMVRGTSRASRFWISNDAYLPLWERCGIGGLGGDEFGNRTVIVRISPSRYAVLALNVPLRRVPLDPWEEC